MDCECWTKSLKPSTSIRDFRREKTARERTLHEHRPHEHHHAPVAISDTPEAVKNGRSGHISWHVADRHPHKHGRSLRGNSMMVARMRLLLFCLHFSCVFAMDPTVFGSAPHITSRPAVDESGLLCFEQQYTPDHRLKLITRGDCYIALQRLMVGDKLNAPMRFSTEHDLGYKIPFFVRYNTCAIGVASSKGLDDYFTLQLVSLVMMYIIRECVEHVDAKRYGGGHPVGWNRDLSAVVLGVTPEYEPPRRQYDAEVYRMLGPR